MVMKLISTLQKAIESLQEKDHHGGDRFHEHDVPNIQLSGHRRRSSCRRVETVLVFQKWMENTIERFSTQIQCIDESVVVSSYEDKCE